MRNNPKSAGNGSIKIIILLGVMTFVLLMLVSVGLKRSLQPNENQRVVNRKSHSPFDGNRAYANLEKLLSLGARNPDSVGLGQVQRYINKEVKAAGSDMDDILFATVLPGTQSGVILITAKLDMATGQPGAGANSHAADSVVLLELVRSLEKNRLGKSILFLWITGTKALSAYWENAPAGYKEYGDIDAVIALHGVGDCYLQLQSNRSAPEWLRGIMAETAQRIQLRKHYLNHSYENAALTDPYTVQGVPTLVLADRLYGGTIATHKQLWATELDTAEQVCPESLQAVGDLLYHAVTTMDGYLGAKSP
mgnify:CR=1 FL=1